MSRGTLVVVAWAAWLTILAAGLVAWTPGDWVQWAPFAAAAAAAWGTGIALLLRRRRLSITRVIPDFSPGAVLVAVGVAAVVQGASLGVWLVYVGGGMVSVGLGVALKETLAARRVGGRE